jgi:hypothetical protein
MMLCGDKADNEKKIKMMQVLNAMFMDDYVEGAEHSKHSACYVRRDVAFLSDEALALKQEGMASFNRRFPDNPYQRAEIGEPSLRSIPNQYAFDHEYIWMFSV